MLGYNNVNFGTCVSFLGIPVFIECEEQNTRDKTRVLSMSWIIILCLAIISIEQCVACSCSRVNGNLRNQFCKDDIELIVRGVVLNETLLTRRKDDPFDDQFLYGFEITNIVQATSTALARVGGENVVYLHTAAFGSLCGVQLTVGTDYVITFDSYSWDWSQQGSFMVYLCGYHIPYDDLFPGELEVLEEGDLDCTNINGEVECKPKEDGGMQCCRHTGLSGRGPDECFDVEDSNEQ
ncbi:uncharacterized protein LOC117331811 isoform X2 [Pecten maximus]|uniref:uncharacterized protein LOC117331811 isoform X2 n=1 Tax=Pecten maximus TaxID=6579 RepID=UPI001458ABBE|nr:uncharacterized protein LOC117331811 isoform X2 [Pecten maximus]